MSNHRRSLIIQAFKKLDKMCDGTVTVEDLRGVYNVKKHPKFLSGEWNEDQCLQEFLKSFDTPNNFDGRVWALYSDPSLHNILYLLLHRLNNYLLLVSTPIVYMVTFTVRRNSSNSVQML